MRPTGTFPAVPVREGELLQLDHRVEIGRRIVSQRLDRVGFRHLHVGQLRHALRVRGHDQEGVAEIVVPQWRDPGRLVSREVGGTQVPALSLDKCSELVRDGTAVERVLPALGDASDRRAQGLVLEQRPYRWRGATGQIEGSARLVQRASLLLEVHRQASRHGESLAGEVDRGSEQVSEGLAAEALVCVDPSGDGARNAHRPSPCLRDGVEPLGAEECRRRERPRTTAAVQGGDLTGRTVVEDAECVSTDPVHVRPHNREDSSHGDDGVGRGAAVLQDAEPRLRRQRVVGRDRTTRTPDVRSVLRRIRGRALHLRSVARRVGRAAGSQHERR